MWISSDLCSVMEEFLAHSMLRALDAGSNSMIEAIRSFSVDTLASLAGI